MAGYTGTTGKYRILVAQQNFEDNIMRHHWFELILRELFAAGGHKCSTIDIFLIKIDKFEETVAAIYNVFNDAKNKDASLILTLSFHDIYSSAMLDQKFLMELHHNLIISGTHMNYHSYTFKWSNIANFGDHMELKKHIAPYRYRNCKNHEIFEDISRIVDNVYHN
jgi:hypothetical protein